MKKKILFVLEEKYDAVTKLLDKAGITYSSEYGLFHFDLLSCIIGGSVVGALAILISVFN
jgi:hypothetical protein